MDCGNVLSYKLTALRPGGGGEDGMHRLLAGIFLTAVVLPWVFSSSIYRRTFISVIDLRSYSIFLGWRFAERYAALYIMDDVPPLASPCPSAGVR